MWEWRAAIWLAVHLLSTVSCQMLGVLSQEDHNLIYQIIIPPKEYRKLYYTHPEGFETCGISLDFFSMPSQSAYGFEDTSIKTKLIIKNTTGHVIYEKITGDDKDDSSAETAPSFNVTKAGNYPIQLENLDAVEATSILMASFNNCTKFKKIVSKDDMEDINRRAESAIGTLFHNIVELEQSETRLNQRKESRLV